MDNIKALIVLNNRDYRQFIFGMFDEIEYLRNLKPFLFEVGGMQTSINRRVNCNPLVNWTVFLNLLYW